MKGAIYKQSNANRCTIHYRGAAILFVTLLNGQNEKSSMSILDRLTANICYC